MRLRRIIAGVFLLAAPGALTPQPAAAQGKPPWLISEIAVLTGPAATVGTRLRKASVMWADEVNSNGGIAGRKVELLLCDDAAMPEKAVACARDAIHKGAVLILDESLTAAIEAVMAVAVNGPTVLTTSPNVSPAPDTYTFQVSPSDAFLTTALTGFLKQNGLTTLGMVVSTDASGEVGVANAQKIFPQNGIALKLARIDLRATDASTQLASVAGSDVKLVYSDYSGGGAATVVKSFYNLGLTQPLVVSYANVSDAFITVIKDVLPRRLLAIGVRAVVPQTLKDARARAKTRAFMAAYQKRYGERADQNSIIGRLNDDVAEAVLRSVADPSDPKAVKKYLETTPVDSLQTVRFSPTSHVGLDQSAALILELKNGAWEKAEPVH